MPDEYVIVEKSTLDSIGDTVRSATGTTNSISVNNLNDAVAATVTSGGVLIDSSLTQSGYAADAKATGDALRSLSEEKADQADVDKLKQDVAAITPDDTVVDGKPWTSKKIVDTICQPFEESGNPVQVYPIEAYPLGVKVSWEPVQKGSGDPSPENIRPISGRDRVSVTRCGKNLIDTSSLKQETLYGVTVTPNNDGSLTVNGTATQTGAYMLSEYKQNLLINGITYTLSGTPSGADGLSLQIWNREWLGDHVEDTGNGRTFTPSKQDIVPHGIAIRIQGGKSYDNAVLKPQLEIGSSRTDFETYTGDTYDIALPETVYGGTLDVETGVMTVEHEVKILNGTENWKQSGTDSTKYFVSYGIISIGKKFLDKIGGKSSHFPVRHDMADNEIQGIAGWGTSLYIRWAELFTTVNDIKSYTSAQYAAGTPVQVYYKLAEPYTIQLTPQQIAALSGVNTLYTDADGVVVTGAEDPKHTITELKNAIISLGGNV